MSLNVHFEYLHRTFSEKYRRLQRKTRRTVPSRYKKNDIKIVRTFIGLSIVLKLKFSKGNKRNEALKKTG